jgi:hypothetical protein
LYISEVPLLFSFNMVLGFKSRAVHMLGKGSTSEIYPQHPPFFVFVFGGQGLRSRLQACKAGSLQPEPHLHPSEVPLLVSRNNSGWSGTRSAAQATLELRVLLLLPPECSHCGGPATDFLCYPIMVRKGTWNDFTLPKLVKICFVIWQTICLGDAPCAVEKNVDSAVVEECSLSVHFF